MIIYGMADAPLAVQGPLGQVWCAHGGWEATHLLLAI